MIYLVVAAVVAIGLVLFVISRSRRSSDGVDSFRRQIDALSAEARRPVIDQVQNAAERDPREPPAAGGGDGDGDGDGDGGARGT